MFADGGAPAPRLLRGAFTTLIMLIASGVAISWVHSNRSVINPTDIPAVEFQQPTFRLDERRLTPGAA